MKTLLHTVRDSIYNPSFYHSLLTKPLRSSFGYFFSLVAVLAAISAVVISFSAVPAAHSFFASLGPKVLNYYPDGLEVTFKDGTASTNVDEPFFLQAPNELASSEEFKRQYPDISYLLIINTKDKFDLELFQNYGTLALLNRDTLAYLDDHGQVRIQPLDQVPNMTITKSQVASLVGKAQPLLGVITVILPFLIFFGMALFYASTLLMLLVGALLVWGIGKIKKMSVGYAKAYQIAMHAATLGLLTDAGFVLFLPRMGIPFLSLILVVIVTWLNLKSSTKEETQVA